jgi:CxxC motif-containing protein (DUF1111 family)
MASRDPRRRVRHACAAFACVAFAALTAALPLGQPGLSSSESSTRGAVLFSQAFTRAEGLGPDFNAESCVSCHATPRPGGAGSQPHTLVPWTYGDDTDGLGVPAQQFTITAAGDTVPLPVTTPVRRRTPSLFGLGYLEAIPDTDLRAPSDPFDASGDGISGRLPWREACFGRFGWQSTVCDIPAFVAGALSRELGIETLPRSRSEIADDDAAALAAFVRSLAPLPPTGSDDGAELFERAQCAACHRPLTGVIVLDGQAVPIRAYTDLLLHEMGDRPLHTAQESRTELRTPPLWGLGSIGPPYLHDGSARTIEEAIRRHGGEASRARQRFAALTRAERARLVRFVASR